MRNMTEDTTAEINARRLAQQPENLQVKAARLEGALDASEQAGSNMPAFSRRVVVAEVSADPAVATLHAVDESGPSLQVDLYVGDKREVFREGAEFYLDLVPVAASTSSVNPGRSGTGTGGETKPITGTTGPQGSRDVTARMATAEGGPVSPDDPNATGPSSDKQQPVKGELEAGQQTGGTTGKGTSDGTREDSQFARHHGTAPVEPGDAGGLVESGKQPKPEDIKVEGNTQQDVDDLAADLELINSREDLLRLAGEEGVTVHAHDTKPMLAKAIAQNRLGK